MAASSLPSSPAPPRRRATKAPAPLVERRLPPAWRALLVGALVIPPSALFGIYSYEVVQALHWTMQSLKCGPVFVLTAHTLIFDLYGQRDWGQRDLMMLGYTQWFTRELRDNPMPYQLEAMKMGHASGVEARRLLVALLLAAALGAIAAFWANLHIYYHYGAATAQVRPAVPLEGHIP